MLERANLLPGKWHAGLKQLLALTQGWNLLVQPVGQRQIPLYFIIDTVNKDFFVSSSLAVIMKFCYCSGFICLLMNMNVVSLFPTLSLHRCLKALLLISWHHFLSTSCVLSCKCRLGWSGHGWAWGQLMGGSAGANLITSVQSLGSDPLEAARDKDCDFQARMQRAMGWVHYFWVSGFGRWTWVNERYPCCRDSGNCLLFIWAGQSRSIRSMADELYVLSRKLFERCNKSCGEGSLLLLPSCSQVDSWESWEDGLLLSREVPGCCSLAAAATVKAACPFLMLPVLHKPSNDIFLQGSTGGCHPLEMPLHHPHPVYPTCSRDLVVDSVPEKLLV